MRAALVLVVFCAGCYTRPAFECTRSYTIGHPTMTTDAVSIGPDARVREVSEGAKGFSSGAVRVAD